MKCDLNEGRTLIVPVYGWQDHVQLHRELPGKHHVTVRVSWPPGEVPTLDV